MLFETDNFKEKRINSLFFSCIIKYSCVCAFVGVFTRKQNKRQPDKTGSTVRSMALRLARFSERSLCLTR